MAWIEERWKIRLICDCCDAEIPEGGEFWEIDGEIMCEVCKDAWVEERRHYNE
jgi:hypothetical protein